MTATTPSQTVDVEAAFFQHQDAKVALPYHAVRVVTRRSSRLPGRSGCTMRSVGSLRQRFRA